MLAVAALFDLLIRLAPIILAFVIMRRVGRFMNAIEARAASIDERLERIEKSGALGRRKGPQLSERDRVLLELAQGEERRD